MLVAIAAGLEPPVDIAVNHGYTPESYAAVAKTRAFQQALAAVARKMESEGITPDILELATLQEMTTRVTRQLFTSLTSEELEPKERVQIANLLFNREDTLTKRTQQRDSEHVSGGEDAFVINITLPSSGTATVSVGAAAKKEPIDVTPVEPEAIEYGDD